MSAGAGLAVYLPWQWVVLVVIGGCSCYIQVVVVVVVDGGRTPVVVRHRGRSVLVGR